MVSADGESGPVDVRVEVFQDLHYRQQSLPGDTVVALWLFKLGTVVSDYALLPVLHLR